MTEQNGVHVTQAGREATGSMSKLEKFQQRIMARLTSAGSEPAFTEGTAAPPTALLDELFAIYEKAAAGRPAIPPQLEGVREIVVSKYAPDEGEDGNRVGFILYFGAYLLISKRTLDEYWQAIQALGLPVYLPGRVPVNWAEYWAEYWTEYEKFDD